MLLLLRPQLLPLPEPVEDRTEVLRVMVQTENISILGGVHHVGQPGVRELGESLPGGLEHLSTNVELYPGHLRGWDLLFSSLRTATRSLF